MSDDTKALVERLREPIPWEPTTRGDRPTYQLWENHTMMVDAQRDQAADTIERLERDRYALAKRCEKLREALQELLDTQSAWDAPAKSFAARKAANARYKAALQAAGTLVAAPKDASGAER